MNERFLTVCVYVCLPVYLFDITPANLMTNLMTFLFPSSLLTCTIGLLSY